MNTVGVVDIDLDAPADARRTRGRTGPALLIGRHDGVPVGSHLYVDGMPACDDVAVELTMRTGSPPPAVAGALHITVAVCTKDRPDLLARCLAAIGVAAEVAAHEVQLDLLVVDNASSDDRTRDAALAASARCVREPVPGLDFARNRAVAESRGEIIAFVDDDVVVDVSWLRTMRRAFAATPEALAITGQVLAYRLDTPARLEFERTSGFSLGWQPSSWAEADGADLPFRPGMGVGCNMAFRRSALDVAGAFDVALDTGRPMPGGGDLDMVIRMVIAGRVVYEPSMVVFHEHRATWPQLRYQFYTWGKGWAAVLQKWHRDEPRFRQRIRNVSVWTFRGFVADFVRGPRRTGRYRRWHCLLLATGFLSGWSGAYGRSVRRVARRVAAVAATSSAHEERKSSGRTTP